VSRAAFARPDGRSGSYRDWLAEVAARWQALSLAEQTATRDAAIARLAGRIQAAADGPTLLHLYDEIGYFGVWPADVVAALSDIKGDVEVRLNSPGGSVFDGLAIYAALKEHSGSVGVVVDGLAASAASFIAMAAAPGRLEVQPNGTLMIHDAWGACVGGEADMRATADVLGQQTANIASIYAERGGRTAAEYRELMAAETWAVGQEAVDLGLADRVRQAPAKGSEPAALPVAAAVPWSVTITATAVPVLAKAMPVHHTATEDSAWDGPAAVAAMSADDTVLEYCHAWQSPEAAAAPHEEGDDDADDQKGNYKFPHHRTKGGPANLAACRNGLARLSSADIPDGDRAGVKAHLQAHLDDGEHHETSDRAGMPAWMARALSAKEAAN
jgi:ATP-dependent Clp endopeptidase proteolytic subunit ClpP